jgi:hypothetical protein
VVREHPIQKIICDVLKIELAPPGRISKHGVVWYAIDMAAYSGEVPGARIERGCVAGVLDLYIIYQGRAHHPEIKAVDGILSPAQQSVSAAILAAGGQVGFVRDAAEMIVLLDAWRIPRNNRVRL